MCHDGGATGAPRVGLASDWSARLPRGRAALLGSALRGVPSSAMMAKGGHPELSDTDVTAAVDYLLSKVDFKDSPALPLAEKENPSVRKIDDKALADEVATAIRTTGITGIQVATGDGRVTLTGMVEKNDDIRKAEQAARGVAGVRAVDNKLISAQLFEHD